MKVLDLLEAVKVQEARMAPLYHATNPNRAGLIIDSDILKAGERVSFNDQEYQGISLTRDLNFAKNWATSGPFKDNVIFVLDQQQLSHNYKIIPVDWFQSDNAIAQGHGDIRRQGETAEAEEYVITTGIKNLDRYIINILVSKRLNDVLEKCIEQEPPVRIGGVMIPEEWMTSFREVLNHPKLKII